MILVQRVHHATFDPLQDLGFRKGMAAINLNRHKFHHPFEPYSIQKQLMTALYQCIEDGKIGIFESPTGKQSKRKIC